MIDKSGNAAKASIASLRLLQLRPLSFGELRPKEKDLTTKHSNTLSLKPLSCLTLRRGGLTDQLLRYRPNMRPFSKSSIVSKISRRRSGRGDKSANTNPPLRPLSPRPSQPLNRDGPFWMLREMEQTYAAKDLRSDNERLTNSATLAAFTLPSHNFDTMSDLQYFELDETQTAPKIKLKRAESNTIYVVCCPMKTGAAQY